MKSCLGGHIVVQGLAGSPYSYPPEMVNGTLWYSLIGPHDLNINMSSCTECSKCQRLVYDEDIMSNWSALDSDYNTQ